MSVTIEGNGAPSKSTVGSVNDLYKDLDSGQTYICAYVYQCVIYKKTVTEYIWEAVNTSSSSGSGEDGISPTVSITEIDGGHRVTITDAVGTKYFDVMDGADGADGSAATVDIPTSITEFMNDTDYSDKHQIIDIAESVKRGKVMPGYRDVHVIPDKYNTGVDDSVELTVFAESAVLGTVTSDDGGTAPKITYDSANSKIVLNYYASNTNLAGESVVENYDFSEFNFSTTNVTLYTEAKTVIFKNCKFKSFSHDASTLSNLSFIFENCTFVGCVGGSNITLNSCYIGDSATGDAMTAFYNYHVNDCLVANLLNVADTSGTHIDGIQIFGSANFESRDISLSNVRFSIPNFYYDGSATSYINAAIMVQLEKNNADGLIFEDIIVDMGGQYTPFYSTDPASLSVTNVMFKNVAVSDNYKDKTLFYANSYLEETKVINTGYSSELYVSSVWKDSDNKTHIICTNSSVLSEKTLKVKTDSGEYEFSIDRAPSQSELLTNETYQGYTYSDMPYDVECIIEENVNYVVCYDGNAKIRFVNFTSDDVYISDNDDSSSAETNQYAKDTGFVYPLYHDIYVIPDKHNTGVDDDTCVLTVEVDVVTDYGVKFRSDTGAAIKIDFNKAPNKTIEGEIVIENVDFTSYTEGSGYMNTYGYTGNGVTIKFINCKFINFLDGSHTTKLIKTEFTNCSFTRYSGSYAVFNNCYFGGGDLNGDPMNPSTNCTFNNCYCSDIVQKTEEAGTNHMDGMQSTACKNLYFNNCRWEVPDINYSVKAGGMNVAIYVQPSDNARNVIFDHCHINGGGYYTLSCADNDISVLNNVKFIEPFIGYCYKASNPLYDSVTKELLVDPSLHDSLYVSSVWKDDDGYLRFLVTNDTEVDRDITVKTNLGESTFTLPRTYKATEYDEDTKNFSDLPIDVENVIEQTGVTYAIFYEGNRQIRFVNFDIYRVRKPD